MNGSPQRTAMAAKANVVRLLVAIAGVAAMAWAYSVFSVFRSEDAIVSVARAVVAGETFKRDGLAAIDARTQGATSGSGFRSMLLGEAATIRLRRAEDAIRIGDVAAADQRLDALARIVDATFDNAPDDAFIWLVRFWLDSARNGLRSDNLPFLRASYEFGPYEGWIALKRERIALAAFAALPDDLRERAISEFVGLVKWGLVAEATAIAAGPGRALRPILFSRLKDLNYDRRRAFADAVYGLELDDVPVPGIAPPKPNIPMPVLPPDL